LYFARMIMANTKAHVLIVGFGDVGERVARLLQTKQSTTSLTVLIRDPTRNNAAYACGASPVFGDLSDLQSLSAIPTALTSPTSIFHFAPPPSFGLEDTHTRNLLAILSNTGLSNLPKRLIYISTTGVYGDCDGAWIDETQHLNPQTDRAKRRVDAESVLRGWAEKHQVLLTILRVPGIYAADRLPIARLKAGTPTIIAEQDVYTNHIHADDLAAACVAAMALDASHTLNIVDDSELKMGDYFDLIADHFHLPRPARISRREAEAKISPAMLSFMRESRRIQNARMKDILAMRLCYSTVADFLTAIKQHSTGVD
ncbi:MAG: NAD-dependent epimerase/dehydratase family protein, partial [Pseudomonadota bacterium]